ncbi:hypothetical protein ACFWVP_30845 [Streptomyces sp. NPDC058637]|uniref:hypothetical protein n=1 Tax=Streptomyces sp. NPDC058637 TaxID=3346569 RepID=UPI0036683232
MDGSLRQTPVATETLESITQGVSVERDTLEQSFRFATLRCRTVTMPNLRMTSIRIGLTAGCDEGGTMRTSRIAAVAASAAVIGVLGIAPAFAQGGYTSYITAWKPGKESKQWTDGNTDSVSTSVKFADCSVDNGSFTYAGLQLKKVVGGLPDTVVNRDNNYCDTSSFGDKAAGSYYFNYSSLNGQDTTAAFLSVSTVTVRY